MIPLWVFIVACVGFVGTMIHAYIKNRRLTYNNKEAMHILNCYADQFGMLDWSKVDRKLED